MITAINLAELPAPSIIEVLDYEIILKGLKDDLINRDPSLASVLQLESEPLTKLLEVCAYRELLLRHRINESAKALMLAYARNSDLDQLSALFGVQRQTNETDDRLRERTQLSLEGHSTAGPIGAYKFHALSASPLVKDISITGSQPGEVLVTVLSTEENGQVNQDLLDKVSNTLNKESIRPLTDRVTVQSAEIIDYQVIADLSIGEGPDAEIIRQLAQNEVTNYTKRQHKLGYRISLSGLYAALHQKGVDYVNLITPISDIKPQNHQAAFCIDINVTHNDLITA